MASFSLSSLDMMNILILGAGVLGSMYAGLLSEGGHDVTVLARGKRLAEIREHGIELQELGAQQPRTVRVAVIERLDEDASFDLVLVLVRADQLSGVLPILAASRGTPNVLFLMNNPDGPDAAVGALGAERVLQGFPCAGGMREGRVVHYVRHRDGTPIPTTIGEPSGERTDRLTSIARAFEQAGLPVTIERNIDAWLKTHAALVLPGAPALRIVGGSNYDLAEDTDTLRLVVAAIREGLRVVRALGHPLRPWHVQLIEWMPVAVSVWALRKVFRSKFAEIALAGHAQAARGEIDAIMARLRDFGRQRGVPMPAFDQLMTQAETPSS